MKILDILKKPDKKLITVLVACSLILSFSGGFYLAKNKMKEKHGRSEENAKAVSATIEMEASTRSYGDVAMKDDMKSWGLKRNGAGRQPDPDPGAAQLLSKYNAGYVGDTSQKRIYLTFDEGYENGYTPMILDTLKKHNVKAVFFIVGPYLKTEGELVRRMVEEGHYVGNHTVNHPSLPGLSDDKIRDELTALDSSFCEQFGKKMQFMRPPKGEYSERVLKIADELNYCTLFWSFAYDDWNAKTTRGKDYAVKKISDNMHNGAILLLHAVSKDNAEAMDEVITGLQAEGYVFGDPAELLGLFGGKR